ncbi:MAG: hypothetical protein AAFV88_16530 [Planctomycetota bacterium]
MPTHNQSGVFRRRHLPHWDVEGHAYFITGCLHGSIPALGLQRIRQYRRELERQKRPSRFSPEEWLDEIEKRVFVFTDQLLDQKSPVSHLRDDLQAEVVQNAFLHFAGTRYKLFAFVVMPSHHHWVCLPDAKWSIDVTRGQTNRTPREIISHSIQSYTSNRCNFIRGSSGKYWQDETFDHWIRDENQLIRVIDYIEDNPVVAGLTRLPEEYRWSSAAFRKLHGIPKGSPLNHPPAP